VRELCRDTDTGTSPHRNARRRDDRTGSEQLFERCEISGPRSGDERIEKSLLLGGTDRPAMFAAETAPGTRDELPGVRLAQCEDL
jgi:hypothetical protein